MADLFKLRNHIKHYEWGSPDYIPRLLGLSGDGRPWAEMWMDSYSALDDINLGTLIARDPCRYLGGKTAERYSDLPFLFKLLAVEKPLSIQAHPNLAQAREGFERENRAALAPELRNYKDANHKPEIICALTPFTGMCGFREPDEIERLLAAFLEPPSVPAPLREGLKPLFDALAIPMSTNDSRTNVLRANALWSFFDTLFHLSLETRKALTEYILSANNGEGAEWELMRNCARLYPNDPAILSPLYLNVFCLEPGEAIFLKAGVPHAYCRGSGVELMTSSDNVLRGGLTAKHIDIPELMKILDFTPLKLHIIKPEPGISRFTYPVPCEEFTLTVIRGTETSPVNFAPTGPSICIVTEGELTVSEMILKQGESAFIPPADVPLALQGHFTLYVASVP